MSLIKVGPDGKLTLDRPVVFSCGCGNVTPDARSMMRLAGVPDIPFLITVTNPRIRDYIRQVGLNRLVASLNRNTHAVLYNPITGLFVDLLKAPRNQQVYDNILRVARGA